MFQSYDEDIGMLTNKTSKKLVHYVNKQLKRFHLTTEQWLVLVNLSKKNRISHKLLAEISDKDQSTLTRILDIMGRKNFIERHASENDRRSFVIHITEDGLNICNKVIPFLEEIFKDILHDISCEELKIYRKVLLQINKNIDYI
ncbi:MarR family winged helix-turn-helix transcriptional regulator [Clostridium sp. BJN0013]|uniref:MarR family winged helix-turn-helix transcriptional regulator n=1 Tax=Clostridium sp. BJN0013 TaxID=3236840 RepID=UPI0034C5B4FD